MFLQIFRCVFFKLNSFYGQWEGWDPVNQLNHSGWLPPLKLIVLSRSVVFGGAFVSSLCFFGVFGVLRAFVIGLTQISSFFSCIFSNVLPFSPGLVMFPDVKLRASLGTSEFFFAPYSNICIAELSPLKLH